MLKLREAIQKKISLWDDLISKAKSDKVAMALLRDKRRWLCKNDLFYLGLLTGHTKFVDPFHRYLCENVSLMNWQVVLNKIMPQTEDLMPIEEICDEPKDLGSPVRLYLLFRSAFKTTISTKLHTIQLLLNFPDIHIAISDNTQNNASDNLESIKNLFLMTALKDLFPECIPKGNEWGNKTGFSVDCRKNFTMTGDNVEAIGIGTEVTGRKFHIFKNNDIVTESSVTNEEQLRQSRDFLELHKYLFVNPTIRIEDFNGTKYHFADAYAVLQEDPTVDKYVQKILTEFPAGEIEWNGKRYNRTVPEMFTIDGIKDLMKDAYKFNCQNMLSPEDPKKVKFTKEMIEIFSHIPDGLNYYLVVDPADSEEKRACYTAMKVIGVDKEDNWYWVDGLFDKIDDRERIDEALALAKKWRVFEVLWENTSFGRTDNRNFERASEKVSREERTWMVRPIPASRISKDDRILGLNDRYSRHKIFWPPKLLYYSRFEGKTIDIVEAQRYEFLGFPLVSHKDLLDAESFMLQIDLIRGKAEPVPMADDLVKIKDHQSRGATAVFRRDWKEWKANNFREPAEAFLDDGL